MRRGCGGCGPIALPMGAGAAIGLACGYLLPRFQRLRLLRSAFPLLALGCTLTVFGGAQWGRRERFSRQPSHRLPPLLGPAAFVSVAAQALTLGAVAQLPGLREDPPR